jgi:transglutaminase-like putative cysteine protease
VTARYRLVHNSEYSYDRPVSASYTEARLSPRETAWQTPLEVTLNVEPASWRFRYEDYWGTQVRVFETQHPHSTLDIQATSLVEVDSARRPVADPGTGWDTVRDPRAADRFYEYLIHTVATEPPAEVQALASECAASSAGPYQSAQAICAAIHDAMTYMPGSTEVHTVAADAWTERRGVCQDYAQLVVGALRHVGLPAQYVSGYVHPSTTPEIGVVTGAESHAWVACWLGEWVEFDPTNRADVRDRHIVVGTGRDYHDVPPIKGIVAGKHLATGLAVSVELTRLA